MRVGKFLSLALERIHLIDQVCLGGHLQRLLLRPLDVCGLGVAERLLQHGVLGRGRCRLLIRLRAQRGGLGLERLCHRERLVKLGLHALVFGRLYHGLLELRTQACDLLLHTARLAARGGANRVGFALGEFGSLEGFLPARARRLLLRLDGAHLGLGLGRFLGLPQLALLL